MLSHVTAVEPDPHFSLCCRLNRKCDASSQTGPLVHYFSVTMCGFLVRVKSEIASVPNTSAELLCSEGILARKSLQCAAEVLGLNPVFPHFYTVNRTAVFR